MTKPTEKEREQYLEDAEDEQDFENTIHGKDSRELLGALKSIHQRTISMRLEYQAVRGMRCE